MPNDRAVPDAITDTPQSDALRPQDGSDTTGAPIVAGTLKDNEASPAKTPADQQGEDGGKLDEQLTEDLSVQGGE